MLVDGVALGEREEAFAKVGERREVPSALGFKLAQDIDHRPSCFGRVRPEIKGELAAEQVEVDVGDPLGALAGEVAGDAVGAGVSGTGTSPRPRGPTVGRAGVLGGARLAVDVRFAL